MLFKYTNPNLNPNLNPNPNPNCAAALLLFAYTFLTTIFLVNLLIAQMTNTYEKIKEKSQVY